MSSLLPPLPHSPISRILFPVSPNRPHTEGPGEPDSVLSCLVLSFLVFSRLVRLIPAGNTVQLYSVPRINTLPPVLVKECGEAELEDLGK